MKYRKFGSTDIEISAIVMGCWAIGGGYTWGEQDEKDSIDTIRAAIDAANHPALFLVDTISSFASIDFQFDAWGIDVAVGGSQKGLMMITGMSFTGISERAMARSAKGGLRRSYLDWQQMLTMEPQRFPGLRAGGRLSSGSYGAIIPAASCWSELPWESASDCPGLSSVHTRLSLRLHESDCSSRFMRRPRSSPGSPPGPCPSWPTSSRPCNVCRSR